SGVMVDAAISRHFEDEPLVCGLTHYAHPISCAAALGSIEVLEREGLADNAVRMGERFEAGFERWRADASLGRHIAETRGLGLMRAVVFDRPVAELARRLWDAGVFAPFREHCIWVCPPLCIDADGVDAVLAAFERVLPSAFEDS